VGIGFVVLKEDEEASGAGDEDVDDLEKLISGLFKNNVE
jgi:hypothetical protein